jgi:hypothetical protein
MYVCLYFIPQYHNTGVASLLICMIMNVYANDGNMLFVIITQPGATNHLRRAHALRDSIITQAKEAQMDKVC